MTDKRGEGLPLAALAVDSEAGLPRDARPWRRLRGLLGMERRDVSVLATYAVVTGLLALATPVAVQTLVNTIAFGTLVQPLVVLTAVLLVVLAVGAGLRLLQFHALEYLERRLFVRLSLDLADRLPRVRASVGDRYRPAELVNRFFDVVTVQKALASLLLDGLDVILQTTLGLLLLALYHPALLAFDLVLLAGIALAFRALGHGATAAALAESDSKYATAAWLEEVAEAPTLFRTAVAQRGARDRAAELADAYVDARTGHYRAVMRQVVGLTGVQVLASAGVLGLGGWLVLEGSLTLGQLVAAELVVAVIVAGLAKLTRKLMTFYDLLAGLEKLGKLVDLPLEAHPASPLGAAAVITVEDLQFADGAAGAWRAPVALTLAPGERLVVLARDYAARNPLLDVLFGLRAPKAGRVRVDGVPTPPGALRGWATLVRRPESVSGTLRTNLLLARPDADDGQIFAALAAVGLADEIGRLPDGLGTHLGVAGSPLDQDQQARLGLARALLSTASVLLVDHTLDALCPASLAEVAEGLRADGRTLLVVTRLPSVAGALGGRLRRLVDGTLLPEEA